MEFPQFIWICTHSLDNGLVCNTFFTPLQIQSSRCGDESQRFSTKHGQVEYIMNNAITMMRGKSPRSNVQMSKKLKFVVAIWHF